MTHTALITGASSGIGKELAIIHAQYKRDMVLVARREEKLVELQSDLTKRFGVKVEVIAMDLSESGAADKLATKLTERDISIEYLINNAGFGKWGDFWSQDPATISAMIRLNILTLTELTRILLPQMIERKSGKILNVGSTAGFIPGPGQAEYYATKAYVNSFTEALASELQGTGVSATVLCPGPVETEFAGTADIKNVRAFKSTTPAPASEVAKIGYEAMEEGQDMIVDKPLNRLVVHGLTRILPRKAVLYISKKTMEK